MIGVHIRFRRVVAALLAVFATTAFNAWGLEVYFLRHGETTWNRGKILQGSVPYTDLTYKGVRMAEDTAKGMLATGVRFDRAYTSPYLRARHTAEIVAAGGAGPAPVVDARIREMCFGRYEGVRYDKGDHPDDNLRRFFEDPERYVPSGEGAETFAEVGARLRKFLSEEIMPLEGSAARVLCVTHSLVLRALVREFAGDGASDSAKRTLQPNCCVHVLKYENGRFALTDTGRIFYSPEAFEKDVEPKMVAHRGAGDLVMPEASLPAYSNAVATGCNIVKLDLQRTKDGVVVMGHDTTLKRNMGWAAKISTLNYPDILARGRFLDENGARGSWRIVRLDEALAIVKPVPEFWLDFKDNETFSAEFANQVLGALKAAGIDQSRVMLATFNRRALAYFKQHHPSIRRVGHFSFNHEKVGKGEMRKMALAFRDEYGLYGLNMPISGFKTGLDDVAFLKQNGLWISLWFVQDEKRAAFYKPAMPDAFVTDYVTRAREGWRGSAFAAHGGEFGENCGR